MNTLSSTSYLQRSSVAVFVLLLLSTIGLAQISDKIKSATAGEGKEGESLTISAELYQSTGVSQIILAYRAAGMEQYKEVEMLLNGTNASVTIPGNEVKPSDIEYYFKLVTSNGGETYPKENPEAQAFHAVVRPLDAKDKMVIFLSPDPGSSVSNDDLLVSISLSRAGSSVNKQAAKLYIDDRDVTQFAVLSDDLIVLSPENITPPLEEGAHNIKLELYDNDGKLYHTTGLSYSQVSSGEVVKRESKLKYNISAQLEARNENIQSVSTPYDRGLLLCGVQVLGQHLQLLHRLQRLPRLHILLLPRQLECPHTQHRLQRLQ